MNELRILSRGGQGAVTAAKILVAAAVAEGKYAQTIPNFGQERKGAPVYTFARIAEQPILSHTYVYNPDIVVVFDPYIMELGVDIKQGIKKETVLVINSPSLPLALKDSFAKTGCADAWGITSEVIGNAPPNAAMLGALAKTTNIISIDSLCQVLSNTLKGPKGEKNAESAQLAYERTVIYGK